MQTLEQTQTKMIDQERFIEFITAGNATFTIRSTVSGNRFTYKATASADNRVLFIKLLTGNDNESDYTYMAHISKNDGLSGLNRGKTSISINAPAYIAFNFVFWNCIRMRHMNNLEIWHEGRCCRCGRKLTVPESVASGIGPECAGKTNKYQL